MNACSWWLLAITLCVIAIASTLFYFMYARWNVHDVSKKLKDVEQIKRLYNPAQLKDVDRKVDLCFINLDHRKDRLENIQRQVLPFLEPHVNSVHRISATKHQNGAKGCTRSHIKTLDFALNSGFEHTLILEDDASIGSDEKQTLIDECMRAFDEVKASYDVFVLGSVSGERVVIPHPDPNSLVATLVLSGGCHAYIVHRSYIPVLKAVYVYAEKNLWDTNVYRNYRVFAMDQLHKYLQMDHKWYMPKKNTVLQLPSFSDIDNQFIAHQGIKPTHEIPFCVFTFWLGGPPMNKNRYRTFLNVHKRLNVPVVHITEQNLAKYTLWPVHPAVKYLSKIHQADYFRIYFLLHIGGGYYDIKTPSQPWDQFFHLFSDPNVWMVGVPETKHGMAKAPNFNYPTNNYKKCISNSWFIARKNNAILQEVHDMQHKLLDKHIEDLKQHPPPSARCCFNHENGYPLRWAEILGELMSQVVPKYLDKHVKAVLKMQSLHNYL